MSRFLRPLAFFALLASLSCGGGAPPKAPVPPVHLPHGEEILTRAGVRWIVKLAPKRLFAPGPLGERLTRLFEGDAFVALEGRHGTDPRKADALFVARYGESVLFLLEGAIDPLKMDAAFLRRVPVEAKKTPQPSGGPSQIVERAGPGTGGTETLAIVGVEGALIERGDDRHLRAALRGVAGLPMMPALVSSPLSELETQLEAASAPACIFSPGPFAVDLKGLGHLFALSAAIGACAHPEGDLLIFDGVILGDFRADEGRARMLLDARFSELENSDLGRLMLSGHTPFTTVLDEKRIRVRFGVPQASFLDGLHRATGAELREIVTR